MRICCLIVGEDVLIHRNRGIWVVVDIPFRNSHIFPSRFWGASPNIKSRRSSGFWSYFNITNFRSHFRFLCGSHFVSLLVGEVVRGPLSPLGLGYRNTRNRTVEVVELATATAYVTVQSLLPPLAASSTHFLMVEVATESLPPIVNATTPLGLKDNCLVPSM